MKLNYQIFPELTDLSSTELAPWVILPGLFGSISNWRSVAKSLSGNRPVIVVDQRNHGRSPHADTHTYADMISDLHILLTDLGLKQVHLAGHSMGGKVAMLFALEQPTLLASLTVLDIAPVDYQHSHAPFLDSLLSVDLSNLKSRSDADRALKTAIPDTATRLFLLQSLSGSPGNYVWRINLKVLHKYMPEIVAFPDVAGESQVRTLVLAGQLSSYLRKEHHAKLENMFPNSEIITIPEAGHWLHAEQPALVIEKMEEFLQ